MAQAGIYGIAGLTVRTWAPAREWLSLGVVLGNLLLDADNVAVAVAKPAGWPPAGLRRTFTHSPFFVAVVVLGFAVVAWAGKRRR